MLPWNLVRTVNPNGGVVYGRAVEEQFSNEQLLERILITRLCIKIYFFLCSGFIPSRSSSERIMPLPR